MDSIDFSLVLCILTVVTGLLWCVDLVCAPKRRCMGLPRPWWVEWGSEFFSVFLLVFLLRSFIVEPFRIPSGSMMPTLLVGDFIAVNKFAYGLRLPILYKRVTFGGYPKRGDIIVFRYPANPRIDYVKRVVGLPGDRVLYRGKQLYINGRAIPKKRLGDFLDTNQSDYQVRYEERLGSDPPHVILNNPHVSSGVPAFGSFFPAPGCAYTSRQISCLVPAGHYFVLGDNRDNSADSRYWGFVPDQNLVGRAFMIWFHAQRFFLPHDIDFSRIRLL